MIDSLSLFQMLIDDRAHVTRQYVAVEGAFGKDLEHGRAQALTKAGRSVNVYAVAEFLPIDLLLEFGQNAPALLIGA